MNKPPVILSLHPEKWQLITAIMHNHFRWLTAIAVLHKKFKQRYICPTLYICFILTQLKISSTKAPIVLLCYRVCCIQ